jgi:hypothetical protein
MARQAARLEEYRAKVSDDNGIVRAKVPAPLLRDMKARAGSYLTFRLNDSGEAIMRGQRKLKRLAGVERRGVSWHVYKGGDCAAKGPLMLRAAPSLDFCLLHITTDRLSLLREFGEMFYEVQ